MGLGHSKPQESQSASKEREDSTPAVLRTPPSRRSSQVTTVQSYQTPVRRPSSSSRRCTSSTSIDYREEEEEKWGEFPSGILMPEKSVTPNRPVMLTSSFWTIRPSSSIRSSCNSVERLPPPEGERKKTSLPMNSNRPSSVPVQCPQPRPLRADRSSHLAQSPETDTEYLSKLYDLRTWNMYRLITESREKRQTTYDPAPIGEEKKDTDDDDVGGSEFDVTSEAPDGHPMIFAFEDIE